MKKNNSTDYKNPISIFKLLLIYKWKICIITALPVLITLIFLIQTNIHSKISETIVRPLSENELEDYKLYNLTIRNFSNMIEIYEKEIKSNTSIADVTFNVLNFGVLNIGKEFEEINSKNFMKLFWFNLQDMSLLKKIFKDNEELYLVSQDEISSKIKINYVALDTHNGDEIIIQTELEDKILNDLFTKLEKSINEKIRIDIQNKLINNFNAYKKVNDILLDHLIVKKENILKLLEEEKKKTLNLLKDHARSARELGVDKGILNNQNQYYDAETLKFLGGYLNSYYLKGYLAIEKQIEQLEKLDVKNMISDELMKIDKEILFLSTDKTFDLITNMIKDTPIFNENLSFKVVNIDVNNTKYSVIKKFPFIKTIILSLLIGLSISIAVVLIEDMVKESK